MRSAAPRPDEPEPAREDLDERAGRVYAAHADVLERSAVFFRTASAVLDAWTAGCPADSQAVPLLRQLVAESDALATKAVEVGLHEEELRQDMARFTATAGALSAAFEAGRACERATAQAPSPLPVPGPRHARRRLSLVKGGTVAAFAGAGAAVRHAWITHPAATAAAGVTAATLAAATVAVAPHAAATFTGGGHPSPAPAASIYSATPITEVPVSPRRGIVTAVTRPKVATVTAGPMATAPVPPVADTPSPSDPGQQQGPGWQAPVVSLTAAPLAVDLSAAPLGTVTLSASGGATRWHAWCDSADVTIADDSGSRNGTVDPADPVNLTIAPAPAQDGQQSATCHIWPGDLDITVTLPPLAPASPSPADTDTDTPTPQPS